MDLSIIVNIVLCIMSFILAAISVITVVITLRQNHRMIESTSRPYICVYGESINPGKPIFYLVIKNFGNSPATITKFDFSPDLSHCYGVDNPNRNYLEDLAKTTIAPGQSRICCLNYSSLPEIIHFDVEYKSGKKTYSEQFETNIKSGTAMLTAKNAVEGKELCAISYTLQDMLQKNL